MKEKEEEGVFLREAWQFLSGPLGYMWRGESVPPSHLFHSPSLFRCHLTVPHSLYSSHSRSLSTSLLLPHVAQPKEPDKKKIRPSSTSSPSFTFTTQSHLLFLFPFFFTPRHHPRRASIARAPGRGRTTPPRTAVTPEQGKAPGKKRGPSEKARTRGLR